MFEYVTVSSSSYDPSALATKLNEKSADGWDVVAIVPTGGDVTAFLRREKGDTPSAQGDSGSGVHSAANGDVLGSALVDGGVAGSAAPAQAAEPSAAETTAAAAEWMAAGTETAAGTEAAADHATSEPAVTELMPANTDWAATVSTETPAEPSPVSEPGGWAYEPVASEPAATTGDEPSPVAEPAPAAVAETPAEASPWAASSAAVIDTAATPSAPEAEATPSAAYTYEPTTAYQPEPSPAAEPVAAEPVAAEPAPAEPAPAPEPEPAPVPTVPAGWYADPSGRFELRYWDGMQWTEHVARGGQQYTDPPVA